MLNTDTSVLKFKFLEYLKALDEQKAEEEKKYQEVDKNLNFSTCIFEFSDEFEEFLTQELGSENCSWENLNEENFEESENFNTLLEEINDEDKAQDETVDAALAKGTELTQEDVIMSTLATLFEDEEFKELIDIDGDSEISKEELAQYIKQVSSMDGDENNLSIQDITQSFTKDEDGTISLNVSMDGVKKTEETDKAKETQKASSTDSASSNPGGNTSGNTGATGLGGGDTNSYENMSLSELKAEKDKQTNEKNNLANGTHAAIKEAVQNKETAEEKYLEEIDKEEDFDDETKELLKTAMTSITSKEEDIANKETEINDLENDISQLSSEIDILSAKSGELQAAMDALPINSENEEERAWAESVKPQLEAEKAAVDEQLAEKKEQLDQKQNTDLPAKQEELETLNADLNDLNEDFANLEVNGEKVAEKYADTIGQYMTDFQEAQATIAQVKQEETQKIDSEISKIQEAINIKKQEQINKDKKEVTKNYTYKGDWQNIYNEEIGNNLAATAEKLYGNSNQTGYCLAGVHYTLENTFDNDIPHLPFGSAYMGLEYFRGEKEGYEDFAEHFQEVEVSRDELDSLPAGCIIIWDNNVGEGKPSGDNVSEAGKKHGHICVTMGDGTEISDHKQYINENRDANYAVFVPVG